MPVVTIRIEDVLWDSAPDARREDWRVSIHGLTEDACLGEKDDHLLVVSHAEGVVALALFDEDGAPRALHEIRVTELREHVDEYLAIVARMHKSEASDVSAHMHTLDMAKKVVHDAGARTLARALPEIACDHEGYRRLFSLVLSIVVDVTKLPGAAAHRRHV